jgi:hypothetical protein
MPQHPLPFTSHGALPLGRWTVSVDEASTYVATPDAGRRGDLWREWWTLVDAVRAAVGAVPACWLAGSFLTSKVTPGDLDCVFVLRRDQVEATHSDPAKSALMEVVGNNRVKQVLNLAVDTFVLEWWPRPGPHPGSNEHRRQAYLENRGYWDDLWLRDRHRGAAHVAASGIPTRGYLEVIVDGYS